VPTDTQLTQDSVDSNYVETKEEKQQKLLRKVYGTPKQTQSWHEMSHFILRSQNQALRFLCMSLNYLNPLRKRSNKAKARKGHHYAKILNMGNLDSNQLE